MIDSLKKEREAHKALFRMEKLAKFFPHKMKYHCEKLSEGVISGNPVGLAALPAIKDSFAGFRNAILKRNPAWAERLDGEYATVEHAIKYLEQFLGQDEGEQPTARIFVEHLSVKTDEMRSLAIEIDSEYEEEG